MVINNDWLKAEELFGSHKDVSVLMSAGNSFVSFLQALMTFEEDKMESARVALAETIQHCKSKISSSKHPKSGEVVTTEERILCEVVATDCLLYQAGLIVVNQDITSYIKGGWYLRQAWKSYKRLYLQIQHIGSDGEQRFGSRESSTDPFPDSAPVPDSVPTTPEEFQNLDFEFGSQRSLSGISELSGSSRDHLLAAVCFGYGAFQLFISLCPPKILRLIHFLGFEGDQDEGLRCLEFTSQTDGMMAPLATLVLVYYHSVVRPFFALDGSNLTAGISEANQILNRADVEYPDSALFLYFRSRVFILEGKTEEALLTCRKALLMSANQRETQHVCLYEIGRLCMMKLHWQEAASSFHRLRKESRWARCYYAYLAALSYGCVGDMEKALPLLTDVPKLVKLKNNQLENFVCRRANSCTVRTPSRNQMIILVLEMLYIWTSIPNCSKNDLKEMLKICEEEIEPLFRPTCCLIEGVIYKEFDNFESAEKSLQKAVSLYDTESNVDAHVAAFACFELGMLKSQQGDFQESRQHFQHIKNHYKNFDFESRISVKVSSALKRIAEEEANQHQNGRSCSIQ